MECLKVNDLSFSYHHNRKVLSDISFSVKPKETVGLIGANGVGKSTMLKLLVGLLDGYQGNIIISDMEMNKKNLNHIRQKVGYVFQDSDSQLFMSTVYDDVAFGPQNYGYSKEEVHERTMSALKMVNMEELKDRHIYQLSGGEKKLVSIATILSMEPEIILLDEPSVALDPRNRRNLISVMNNIDKGKIIASHDLDLIMDTCDRTILLSHGRIIKDGKTSEILTDKKLLEDNLLELPLSLWRK